MRRVTGAHEAVLLALEKANRAHGRACTVAEIIAAMSPEEVAVMRDSYAKPVNIATSSVLVLLQGQQQIWSPGVSGKCRYYAARSLYSDPSEVVMPNLQSRRRRVLAFAREAVALYGRAVRAVDVLHYLDGHPGTEDLTPLLVVRDLRGLAQTGELQLFAVRGDSHGTNTYLPAGMDLNLYRSQVPLTWLQEVELAFHEIWTERLQDAVQNDRNPRPIATSEVRRRLVAAPEPHPNLEDIRLLPNALLQLAQSKRPTIRKVERGGQWAILWAPVGVPDHDLDVAGGFATNAERIHEATRRAVERHQRPVTVKDMAAEIERDPALRTDATIHLRVAAADAAKTVLTAKAGVQRQRVNRAVRRVGRVGGRAHYVGDTDTQEGTLYVSFLQIENWWVGLRADEQLSGLEGCVLPCVATGRAMHVLAEMEALAGTLGTLLRNVALDDATQQAASALYESVCAVREKARLWLSVRETGGLELPDQVLLDVPGLTAAELLLVIEPLYPKAQGIADAHYLVSLLDGDIRRVPNPEHSSRFDADPQRAAELLFDRADALMFIAKQWGCMEAIFQANIAAAELGLLRDPAFVLPALESENFDERLVAVACLAFLCATTGTCADLKWVATHDKEPGVRAAAGWAHGLCTTPLAGLAAVIRGEGHV
jgi:hypothetical protein